MEGFNLSGKVIVGRHLDRDIAAKLVDKPIFHNEREIGHVTQSFIKGGRLRIKGLIEEEIASLEGKQTLSLSYSVKRGVISIQGIELFLGNFVYLD